MLSHPSLHRTPRRQPAFQYRGPSGRSVIVAVCVQSVCSLHAAAVSPPPLLVRLIPKILHIDELLKFGRVKCWWTTAMWTAVREMISTRSRDALLMVLVSTVVIRLWMYRRQQRQRIEPKEWPLLGATLETLQNFNTMHDWLLSYFQKGLKTFKVPVPDCTYTYTVDPANVEYILKTNFANFPKGEMYHNKMETLLGDGIFNSDGDAWRHQRKTASFEFASRILRDFSTVTFRDYSLKLADHLRRASVAKQPVDMQDLFARLTLDSICKVGFGVEIGTLSPSLPEVPFAKAFDNANEAVTYRFFDPLWPLKRYLDIGVEANLTRSVKVVDNFTYNVIQTRRAELEVSSTEGKEMKADLLSRFILMGEDTEEQNFTNKTLRDIILNFIIAGRDTTAATLSWFVYLLSLNPEVGDKIFEELHLIVEDNKTPCETNSTCNGEMTQYASLLSYDVISKLHYLHAAITETIRLYPAVPQNPKGILSDDILPDGTVVKKGGLVTYVPYSMGRMTELWGPDAEEFRPERWLKDGVFIPASPYKFTAFQAGPRICLGKDSAYLQMKMATAILCRFFKFQVVQGHPVKYRMMAILSLAHGLKVNVSRR